MTRLFTLLTSATVLLAVSSQAQIQRGNVMVGGDIGDFNYTFNTGSNTFTARIEPKVAWFIKDNFAVGGYLNTLITTRKGDGTSVSYGIGPLARYYFSDPTVSPVRHARIFGEVNAGIEGYNPNVGDNTNGLGLGAGPGVAYFISPNVGLEGLIKYNGIVGFGTAPTSHQINFSFGLQIYLSGSRILTVSDKTRSEN